MIFVIRDTNAQERGSGIWGWIIIGRRSCVGRSLWEEFGRVMFRELNVFGFLVSSVRRDIFGGCILREECFEFDVHEGGKGRFNIL